MRPALLLAFVFALGACACKDSHERTPTTSPTVGGSRTRTLGAAVMLRHEVYAVAIRDAVMRGDVAAARRNAVELGAVTVGGSPEVVEHAKEMDRAANAIAHAATLEEAARGTGTLVRTCADCHSQMHGPTRLETDPAPVAEPGRRVRMRRHIWAMNQLWDGVVDNSEVPWRAGAEVLGDPTLASSELVPQKSSTPEVDRLASSVHGLGVRAMAASDTGVRSEIYGELLTTCADCHTRTR